MSDSNELISRTRHDSLFKRIFSDPVHAAAELRAVLPPQIIQHIDWATLEAGATNMVGKNFKQHHGDLFFRARLNHGHDALVWLMFEHQSTIDVWMPLRLLDLSRVFWNRWRERNPEAKALPAIIPVVVYQGPGTWSAATSLGQLLDVPDEAGRDLEGVGVSCRFVLDDLGAISDEELAGREMAPYAKLGLVVFKYGRDRNLTERLVRFTAEIQALLATEHGPALWGMLMEYTWHVNPHIDREKFIEQLRPIVGPEAETTMLTLADKIRNEGFSDGRNEGHSEERRALVLQLLARRFGALPPEAEARVASAEMEELQDWAMRLLDARSLDEVFSPS